MKHTFVILLCIVAIVNVANATHAPEVAAPTGKIRGCVMRSRMGQKIFAFRGVRYGEPPVGDRRFQVATPAADWKDVFDATKEGPSCPNFAKQNTSEDCLRLNVYTKRLPPPNKIGKKPVMVFFHPGQFYNYSAQSVHFGPQYLMDKEIVLVTVNYRLGSLGFLSTGDSEAPGNLGLKDQVLALRWVQRNIAPFGGNPKSVTIVGYDVGGLSVILHMLSPMSKDLFHKAIAMSAPTLITEPYPTEQKHLAVKQADLLGCPTNTTRDILTCLRSKPVENFTDTMSQFFEWHGNPVLIWKPVVEPEVEGVERFLPDQPVNLIRQGKFYQVPSIVGVTKDEFHGVSFHFENQSHEVDDSLYREINDNWNKIAPITFMYERETSRSKNVSEELRRFYFGNEQINSTSRQCLAKLHADSVIIFPTYRAAKLIAANSKEPVFFYKFSYQGRNSFTMWNATTPYGVVHNDDLQYLFFMQKMFPFYDKFAPEVQMINLYTTMWTNFAQNGEPIPKCRKKYKNIVWDRFVPEKSNYLDISLKPTAKTDFYLERMQEWEKLFPLDLVL